MPPPAYTKRLFSGTATAPAGYVSPAPAANLRWVLLEIAYGVTTPTTAQSNVSVPGPLFIAFIPASNGGTIARIQLHQVVNAGENVTFGMAGTGAFTVCCTGYELSTTGVF